jgi:hypothetical protein
MRGTDSPWRARCCPGRARLPLLPAVNTPVRGQRQGDAAEHAYGTPSSSRAFRRAVYVEGPDRGTATFRNRTLFSSSQRLPLHDCFAWSHLAARVRWHGPWFPRDRGHRQAGPTREEAQRPDKLQLHHRGAAPAADARRTPRGRRACRQPRLLWCHWDPTHEGAMPSMKVKGRARRPSPVAIVNEPLVRRYFRGEDPIGTRIRCPPAAPRAWIPSWRCRASKRN